MEPRSVHWLLGLCTIKGTSGVVCYVSDCIAYAVRSHAPRFQTGPDLSGKVSPSEPESCAYLNCWIRMKLWLKDKQLITPNTLCAASFHCWSCIGSSSHRRTPEPGSMVEIVNCLALCPYCVVLVQKLRIPMKCSNSQCVYTEKSNKVKVFLLKSLSKHFYLHGEVNSILNKTFRLWNLGERRTTGI